MSTFLAPNGSLVLCKHSINVSGMNYSTTFVAIISSTTVCSTIFLYSKLLYYPLIVGLLEITDHYACGILLSIEFFTYGQFPGIVNIQE